MHASFVLACLLISLLLMRSCWHDGLECGTEVLRKLQI